MAQSARLECQNAVYCARRYSDFSRKLNTASDIALCELCVYVNNWLSTILAVNGTE